MRFLVDMPVSPAVVDWLEERGHEAVHVSTIGLYNAKDSKILDEAEKRGQIIITADLDFPRLLAMSHSSNPGVILFRGGNYNEQDMVNLLNRLFEHVSPERLSNAITVVDRLRIRRCPLPIE